MKLKASSNENPEWRSCKNNCLNDRAMLACIPSVPRRMVVDLGTILKFGKPTELFKLESRLYASAAPEDSIIL